MKKFKLFNLILIILFFFKLILTPSFAANNLEIESKLWEALDKNLKKQEEQKQKEQEEDEQKQKEQEEDEQKQKEQEEQRLKQEKEEKRLKQEEVEKRQKEQGETKALLSKLFPKNELSIIAKIGNEIITSYDLEVEIKYLMALSPNIKSLKQEQKINLAKESIIREKVKINEILKYFKLGQEAEADHLDEVAADTYRKLGLKNNFEFGNYLSNYNLTIDEIKKKIEIELLWNKLIYSKYRNQVEIDTEKIKKRLKEEELKLEKKEVFLLSEILFYAKSKKELDKKYIEILKSIGKEGFKNTATIYSISDTAKFGGLIGWIQKNQLSNIVIDEILKINIGEFTKPINVPSGILIIRIDEKKIEESKIDLDFELEKMIKYEKNRKLNQFSFIHYKKIKNNTRIYEN